ncbi:peroxisome biogenesis factor 2 isoform X1 [Cyprinodon tularosa]|uniref:peroxisome biogenesis factor 2 isoform X1 n=1 Tax=Cyprinodon tularosa TaxID=77115 RepID=UPI0018E200E4|nr:peroxisome biogenesis factor 2 isoform X1 [Cyprinodon tularosa]
MAGLTRDHNHRTAGNCDSDSAVNLQTPVLRISQLDAHELDSALEQLLWTQFTQCFQNCPPGVLTPVEPELKALLYLLLWRFTLYSSSATVGQSLLSLRYQSTTVSSHYKPLSSRQKLGLALLTLVPRWLQERSYRLISYFGLSARGALSEMDDGLLQRGLRKALVLVSGLAKFATLVNFLVFLRNGRHPVLAERIAGAQTVFSKPNVVRDVNYQYMNRELLWHGFAEFLIFLLPLVNLRKLKSTVLLHVLGGKSSNEEGARMPQDVWKYCGLCGEWPTMPHTVGCGHVFCYYCIKSHSIADPYLSCPQCGAEAGTPKMFEIKMQVGGR